MTRFEFRAFLDLLMCSDPWPTTCVGHILLSAFADKLALEYGFDDWIDAYYKL